MFLQIGGWEYESEGVPNIRRRGRGHSGQSQVRRHLRTSNQADTRDFAEPRQEITSETWVESSEYDPKSMV